MSRQERWEKNLEMLKSGALGDETSPNTLLIYWRMQESAGYPNASENVRYFEDLVRKEYEKYADEKLEEIRAYVDKRFEEIRKKLEGDTE